MLPSRVFGANEKIAIGGIGVGRRGGQVLGGIRRHHGKKVQFVAMADVDKPRADYTSI